MKVTKSKQRSEPGYPSLGQFSKGAKWAGVAAIGLGAVTGFGEPARTPGVPVRTAGRSGTEAQPTVSCSAATNAPAVEVETGRLRGDVAVMPKLPGAGRVARPAAATNLQAGACAMPATTNEPAARLKGEMPAAR